jgi:hypothetical protein
MMFGHLSNDMLRREWHHELHATDRVVIFPSEMLFVYRVAALLRGLGLALHTDLSTADAWRGHAAALLATQTSTLVESVDGQVVLQTLAPSPDADSLTGTAAAQPITNVRAIMTWLQHFVTPSKVNT